MTNTETIHKKRYKPITQVTIIRNYVEKCFNIDLSRKSRKGKLPDYKKMFSMLCKKYTIHSLDSIGKEIGMPHSTILHQIRSGDNLFTTDKHFKSTFLELEKGMPNLETIVEKDLGTLKNRLKQIHRESYLIRKEIASRERKVLEPFLKMNGNKVAK